MWLYCGTCDVRSLVFAATSVLQHLMDVGLHVYIILHSPGYCRYLSCKSTFLSVLRYLQKTGFSLVQRQTMVIWYNGQLHGTTKNYNKYTMIIHILPAPMTWVWGQHLQPINIILQLNITFTVTYFKGILVCISWRLQIDLINILFI